MQIRTLQNRIVRIYVDLGLNIQRYAITKYLKHISEEKGRWTEKVVSEVFSEERMVIESSSYIVTNLTNTKMI